MKVKAGKTKFKTTKKTITKQEVLDKQKAWGEGIVAIGKVYSAGGDYKTAAKEHIKHFYNYQEGSVLFKPTLAADKQFRRDFSGALSYFIGGDENYPEDHGFAIKPWCNVRWETVGIKIIGNTALTMGNYFFTSESAKEELKVEYSFAYTKNSRGELKIILHDSHLPCKHYESHEYS
ncbi:phosphoribosyl-AMP cyclohydrolase [Isachenkonia alkalipeptolytica]|uniref:Phosphoribosyl-AMP cyclohydrolase n=1 Tax=Isachenkonia alkalipeptolytica TaxID=2565777 RepID=A0AA43XN23_9CLOT|nr:phosphoribosyl-AMP cyclohydrolase [Isachenkonia alkalipeptolytica]NBG89406.1 phosphoribosyl-AMP cyclohydrolase [Isachenkonia alkalipeptolytica]